MFDGREGGSGGFGAHVLLESMCIGSGPTVWV